MRLFYRGGGLSGPVFAEKRPEMRPFGGRGRTPRRAVTITDMEKNDPEKLLLEWLRRALWGTPASLEGLAACDAAAWETLYGLAAQQGVLALLWEVLEPLSAEVQPPKALRLRWAFETVRVERRWRRQHRAVARLAAFYARHGIPMMLLKGCGLSRCYPVPEHRPCGDVDIWLFGHQPGGDAALARELGIEVDMEKEHHTTFWFDGIPVENHYDFLNTRTCASNRRLERLLKRLAARPGESFEMGEARVYLPSATFNALFLLRHAAGHFAGCAIGLRHFVDWMRFVAACHDRIDWPVVQSAVRESGMQPFVDCFLGVCIGFLGLDADLLPPVRRDPRLERRMLEAVLHPPLSGTVPARRLPGIWFRLRRWWACRWMRRMVYDEPLALGFLRMSWLHVKRHLPLLQAREAADRARRAAQSRA